MSGFYRQDERGGAAAGCAILVLAVIAAVVLSVVLCSLLEGYAADPMDGSGAGANAVTLEDFEGQMRESALRWPCASTKRAAQ